MAYITTKKCKDSDDNLIREAFDIGFYEQRGKRTLEIFPEETTKNAAKVGFRKSRSQ